MTKKSKKIDKQTSAIKNEEVIDVDIYEPDAEDIYEPDESDIYEGNDDEDSAMLYDNLQSQVLCYYSACEAEYIGILESLIQRNAEAERRILNMGKDFLDFLGIDSYENVLQLILEENKILKQVVLETRKSLKITY
jgi:hypothetical protein